MHIPCSGGLKHWRWCDACAVKSVRIWPEPSPKRFANRTFCHSRELAYQSDSKSDACGFESHLWYCTEDGTGSRRHPDGNWNRKCESANSPVHMSRWTNGKVVSLSRKRLRVQIPHGMLWMTFWWNRQTRGSLKALLYGVRVQVPRGSRTDAYSNIILDKFIENFYYARLGFLSACSSTG